MYNSFLIINLCIEEVQSRGRSKNPHVRTSQYSDSEAVRSVALRRLIY